MITANVIHRTFHIRSGNSSGTAFAIDHKGKQYLATARHVVEGITSSGDIDIYHEQQWKSVAVDVVGAGKDGIDVAVMACSIQLSLPLPLKATTDGLTYGQVVYFLGFPFGWVGGLERINLDFPMPFVKAGIYSATDEANSFIFIDGYGNPGFSGGPVVFRPEGRSTGEFQVAGIVSNAPTPLLSPIVGGDGSPILNEQNEPIAYFGENQGFVVAIEIQHATNLIDANPIGFELPSDYQSSQLWS